MKSLSFRRLEEGHRAPAGFAEVCA